jgi:hypothetical protein
MFVIWDEEIESWVYIRVKQGEEKGWEKYGTADDTGALFRLIRCRSIPLPLLALIWPLI